MNSSESRETTTCAHAAYYLSPPETTLYHCTYTMGDQGAPTPRKRRIGVMTSGGDAAGMNGVVRSVVRMSIHMGCEAYAIMEGYEGLVLGGDLIKEMQWDDVRGFQSRGGTLIGTARCKAFFERPGRLQA